VSAVLGVDGARGGWAGALVDGDDVRFVTFASIEEALALDVRAIGVDMPIGLPGHGRRACDLAAKRTLGRAHARVFLAPPRAVLAATSYADAAARHRAHTGGHGLSVQTWNIVARIVEVDRVAQDPRLVEVHPELSFARIAGEVLASKKSAAGRAARIAALRQVWPRLAAVPRGDDALDALAVAWSAGRWLAGTAETLPPAEVTDGGDGAPPAPAYDDLGRPMRIVT
jgi:predicted RNase H-like nuclease